jgi:hypothetical protein
MDLKPGGATRRQVLLTFGAAACAASAWAQKVRKMPIDDEIRMLSQIEGSLYRSLRDDLLSRGVVSAAALAPYRSDADWRVAMVATILQGWTERSALYSKVVAEVDRIDPVARGRHITGIVGVWDEFEMRAHAEFGPPVVPLAWENTVKLGEGTPPWRIATFLAMIGGAPMEASVEPVAYLIETSSDRLVLERAAYTLAKLPQAAVDSRLERLSSRSAWIAEAVRSARELRK